MFDDPLEEYHAPSEWTADHVMVRMIWAFETLANTRGRIGPAGFGSGWPNYVHDWQDLLAQEEKIDIDGISGVAEAEQRRQVQDVKIILPPNSHELSLMDEAFHWPMRYLGGEKAIYIEICIWALKRSKGYDTQRQTIGNVHHEATMIAAGLKRDKVLVR